MMERSPSVLIVESERNTTFLWDFGNPRSETSFSSKAQAMRTGDSQGCYHSYLDFAGVVAIHRQPTERQRQRRKQKNQLMLQQRDRHRRGQRINPEYAHRMKDPLELEQPGPQKLTSAR